MINKWLEETCDEFENEEKCLITFTVILEMKVIVRLSILLLLMNFQDDLASWLPYEPLYVEFNVGKKSVIESLQKKAEENCNFT